MMTRLARTHTAQDDRVLKPLVPGDEICKATAAAFSSRRGDDVPSPAALKAIAHDLNRPSGEATALDLLHALATLSDARNPK